VFAVAQAVYDLWDRFFAYTAFPRHQNADVRGGHLDGFEQSPVQGGRRAHNPETLFGFLDRHLAKT
jgi:hypothetical protein